MTAGSCLLDQYDGVTAEEPLVTLTPFLLSIGAREPGRVYDLEIHPDKLREK